MLNQDIRFIKQGSGSFQKRNDDELALHYLVLLFGLPLGAFSGLAFYRRKMFRDRADVLSFRSRKAMKEAKRRLKRADSLLAEGNPDSFYAEIAQALWKYLSDRLSIDLADLSIEKVVQQLSSRSISADLEGKIREALELCEYSRFAPSGPVREQKQKMYDLARTVIITAEKEMNG